jgi:hypothetical protein
MMENRAMKNAIKTTLGAVLVALALVGCSSGAQLVRQDARGGRIALHGAYMPAVADARLLALEHCQGRFQLLELGHAVEYQCRNPKLTQHVSTDRAGALVARAETRSAP